MKRGGWSVAHGKEEEEEVMVAAAVSRWVEQSDARGPVWCGVSKRVILAPTVVWWMMIGVALPERAGDLSMQHCTALHCAFWHVRSEVKSKASDLSCRLTAVLPRARAIQL